MRGSGGARRGTDLNELGIIPDGAILIRDGIIREAGPSRRVEALADARGAFEINAAGRVVMPGFIDCHTHLMFPPPAHAHEELQNAERAVRTSTAKRLTARARDHLHAMARHGTTTVEVKTGYGPDDRIEMKLLRALAAFRKEPIEVISTILLRLPANLPVGEAHAMSEWYVRQLLPKIRQRGLAQFADVAWMPDPCLHDAFIAYIQGARTLGFGCKVHAQHENPGEAIAAAAEYFADSVDHLEHATRSEAAIMAGQRTIATLLPYPSFHRRSAVAPARALIEAAVPVALASDFHPRHTPNLNMQTVVALGCLQMGLTPAEAISAATINAAHALGCASRAGSLEPGKFGDVLVLNTPDYREVAYHFGTNLVRLTIKRGECIYREGEVARRSVHELTPA